MASITVAKRWGARNDELPNDRCVLDFCGYVATVRNIREHEQSRPWCVGTLGPKDARCAQVGDCPNELWQGEAW